MNEQQQVVIDTVKQTVQQLTPVILAAVVASDPKAAAAMQLAPVATQFLQLAAQLQAAGGMSGEQLAALFKTVGDGILSSHNAWIAMDKAEGAP